MGLSASTHQMWVIHDAKAAVTPAVRHLLAKKLKAKMGLILICKAGEEAGREEYEDSWICSDHEGRFPLLNSTPTTTVLVVCRILGRWI
jgi:hypothetical protein